ncbi:restriction endonuclease subunit S [Acinetobacter sp. YH16042]|uniref:restriction endonuclease subunit S n=1 Tax=Acinetobacter sp. YH16042 TaxID=2601186 RepID=UPI0015D35840|nr:restriction endonuclease subunit S [Acinetobacter sp. YH16042]
MTSPKLRFKEFDGDWSKVSLDKISKVFDGTHQTPNYVESGIKFVSVENIQSPYDSDKFITAEAFKKDFKNKPQLNDILMTRITAGEIGATAIVNDSEPLAYYVSLALIRPKANVSTPFLNQYIGTPFFKNELHKRIIHVAFPKKINLGDINECLISLPNKQEEQIKIASFLSAVDEKISQLTQKYELLSQYKQGMMQKLFSQQIRFKADDESEFGEWQETTLGEVVKFSNSKRIPLSEGERQKRQGDYRYYGASGVIDYVDDYLFDGEYILIGEDGANILTRSSPLAFIVEGQFWVNNHAHIFQSKQGNNLFLATYLESLNYEKFNSGTAQPKLNLENLKKVSVINPCLEEQTKIANFLTVIDQKIETVAQQIEQAKQWKKGLLQQMFV